MTSEIPREALEAGRDLARLIWPQSIYGSRERHTEACARALCRFRAEGLREAAEHAEAFMHAETDDSSAPDRLDEIARYSNGSVRRIVAAIRAEAARWEEAGR